MITWPFVRRHAGVPSWQAVAIGMTVGLCGPDVAVGCAEARMAESADPLLVDLSIAWGDRLAAAEVVARLAAKETGRPVEPIVFDQAPPWYGGIGAPDAAGHPIPDTPERRLWQYLAFRWIDEGHPFPGEDARGEAPERSVELYGLWWDLGADPSLGFVVVHADQDEDDPIVQALPHEPGPGWDDVTRRRISLWLDREREALGL